MEEWRIIVFTLVCVGTLACMWRGGPCCIFFRRCKERLLKKPPDNKKEAAADPASRNELRA